MLKFVCPKCDSDDIYENNILQVRLKVKAFDTDSESDTFGEPSDFSYPWMEVDDTIRTVEENEAPRWYCGNCCEDFNTLKEIEEVTHG